MRKPSLQAAVEREATTAGYVKTEIDQLRDAMNAMVRYVESIVAQGGGDADHATPEAEDPPVHHGIEMPAEWALVH